MNTIEPIIIALGLAMDAFAVAICKGMTTGDASIGKGVTVGLYFGSFQGIMPLIGYWLAGRFSDIIESVDHWIAFALLLAIGVNMMRESRDSEAISASLSFKEMLPLSVATSIDALAVGVTFAFLKVEILPSAGLIASITFILSFIGVLVGSRLGEKFKENAVIFGGAALILMGVKILLEHIGVF